MSRFIPAYAGNARSSSSPRYRTTVHPRIRGERNILPLVHRCAIGSSPHTRGTLVQIAFQCGGGRFIPAYAGNASDAGPILKVISVHPRIRGERQYVHQDVDVTVGSSPHTRGTPAGCCRQWLPGRFIPAYAGNARSGAAVTLSRSVHPRIRGERNAHDFAIVIGSGSSPHTRGTHFQ